MRAFQKHARLSKVIMFAVDMLLAVLATYVAMSLRFEGDISARTMALYARNMPSILLLYTSCFVAGRVYSVLWQYAGVRDLLRLSLVSLGGCILTLLLNLILALGLSRSVLILVALFVLLGMGGFRLLWRLAAGTRNAPGPKEVAAPLLIVGAGEAGAYIVKHFRSGNSKLAKPVIVLDDDPKKLGLRMLGVPVAGRTDQVAEFVQKYGIKEIVVAIPSLPSDKLTQLVGRCSETGCRVRVLSWPLDAPMEKRKPVIVEVNTADFLSRGEITLATEQTGEYLSGKKVLVTGGGGSIGSELCRQIMDFAPKLLIVLDAFENGAYELECELKQKHGQDCAVEVVIGSIRDKARLDEVFSEYRPEIVFHTAAYKHVPLMEKCPAEAIKNNVFGTKNLLESADASGVERLVQISTDKAVNPTNIMGATKRVTEMLIQSFAEKSTMKCMAVRFGNVLGSHGSVIPLMEAQIKRGGPVTVTHKDITRYFMTIPEAAQLVLCAGGIAQTGSICVLDMGQPVRILDLAKQLIRAHGLEPDVDIPITITGLRPGEKLYEELLMESERKRMTKTSHSKIMVAAVDPVNTKLLNQQLRTLMSAIEKNDERAAQAIKQMTPTYRAPGEERPGGEWPDALRPVITPKLTG